MDTQFQKYIIMSWNGKRFLVLIDWLSDWSLLSTHNKTYLYIHENTDIDYISVQSNKKSKPYIK